ncbi:MAG: hypothetical protein REJ23_12615 [Brevundimonas sp.]|nr:hypothetical protein [Brevundimonas sp.]
MKPRRPKRVRRNDFVLAMIQHHRLAAIARDELEPFSDREDYFLKALRAGRRVRARDFVVPAAVFRIEQARMQQVHAIIERACASKEEVVMV